MGITITTIINSPHYTASNFPYYDSLILMCCKLNVG